MLDVLAKVITQEQERKGINIGKQDRTDVVNILIKIQYMLLEENEDMEWGRDTQVGTAVLLGFVS